MGQGKADTGASFDGGIGLLCLEEPLKNMGEVIGVNTSARIADA